MATSQSRTQHYRPYFTEEEVQKLSEKQRGKLSQTQEERARQHACAFIDAIGAKLGFPKRTTATAQALYHRFHLFFHRKTWGLFEVTVAALYVSTKIHDTLKKPRDLLMAGYVLRYPELAAKSKAVGGEIEMDSATIAKDTAKVLGIERLILESVCFNFTVKMPFPYLVKIAKSLRASKPLTLLAWRLTIDSNRSQLPLMYPPHALALGCIYVSALLSSFEEPNQPAKLPPPVDPQLRSSEELAAILGQEGPWESQFKVRAEDLDEIAHILLDLLHTYSSALMQSSTSTSPSTPSTPSSPKPHNPQNRHAGSPAVVVVPFKPDQLIRLKIVMRGKDLRPRDKGKGVMGTHGNSTSAAPIPDHVIGVAEGIGTNIGTTRFLFNPPGFSGTQRPSALS